ncbi:MAG: Rne/Rng family ribonuclease [SAR324 cluster bacterium]|nr:Rne/Rng family ribonuclease [SAR324 cluster bacterium]MBL7035877.1 Rne/Rng family ribonuclease [SAR324 cluster bacterium]
MTETDHKILINVEDDETRIALTHGSTLDNLYIEQTHRAQKVGNIYCGKVVKVQPSFQAAFIDYGEERHGFLSLSDVNYQVYKPNREGRGRPSITQVLKPGQKILVQVIKDEIAHKGASLTTNISLAGRFLVFMPDSDKGGVSRKIENEEQRMRLRHLLKGLGGEDASAIIRTAGVDRSLTELKRDFMILRRTWNEIKDKHEEQSAPGLLYQEEDAMIRMIRDYFHESVAQVVIDEPVAFQHALEFFQAHMPSEQKKLQLYLGEKSLFSSYDIEGQIEVLHHHQVPLPSGGSLVIMPTEALVAIDVNSGRSTQERNIEATAFRTNMEAAEEVSRQLRLRNLGGLIVVDFIDMDNSKNRLAVENKIEEAMAADKAKISFGVISKFGLLELSRQRISSSLSRNSITLTLANRILRKIHDSAIEQKVLQVHLRLPLELATHLLNVKRQRLTQIETDYAIRISITPDTLLGPEEIPEMEVTLKEHGGGETRTSVPISASDMRDEKPGRKKGGRKKPAVKKELPTTDLQKSEKDKEEQNTEDKKSGTAKSETIVQNSETKKETERKQEQPVSVSTDKKTLQESPVAETQTETAAVQKLLSDTKLQSDTNVEIVLFQSKHQAAKKQDPPKNESQSPKQDIEKEAETQTSTYQSVHLEAGKVEKKDSTNKITGTATENDTKEVADKTPMFNSVHLGDKDQTKSKAATSKKEKSPQALKSSKTEPKILVESTDPKDSNALNSSAKTPASTKAVTKNRTKAKSNKSEDKPKAKSTVSAKKRPQSKKTSVKTNTSGSIEKKKVSGTKAKQDSKVARKQTKPTVKKPKTAPASVKKPKAKSSDSK